MSLGSNIKKIRNECNLTQEELGNKIGVKPITIRKYESDEREPNLDTLNKIATALKVPVTYLLYDDNEFMNHIDELNKIMNSSDEIKKIMDTEDESNLTISQKLFKSSYNQLKKMDKEFCKSDFDKAADTTIYSWSGNSDKDTEEIEVTKGKNELSIRVKFIDSTFTQKDIDSLINFIIDMIDMKSKEIKYNYSNNIKKSDDKNI